MIAKLIYEEVSQLDPSTTYKDLLDDDPERIGQAILSISLHDDWNFAQDVCFKFAYHDELWVRRNSITGLGHIARIHGTIDLGSILTLFGDLTQAGLPACEFHDMFRDILVYVARKGRRNI